MNTSLCWKNINGFITKILSTLEVKKQIREKEIREADQEILQEKQTVVAKINEKDTFFKEDETEFKPSKIVGRDGKVVDLIDRKEVK